MLLVHSAVILAVYFMLRKKLPLFLTFLVTLLTTASFMWPLSHPWHDLTAHLWGIAALALLVRHLPITSRRSITMIYLTCGVLAGLAFMTKTPLGLLYGALFFSAAVSGPHRTKAGASCLGGFLAATGIVLIFIDVPAFIQQITAYSLSESQVRFPALTGFGNWFVNYYWIIFFIMGANFFLYGRKKIQTAVVFTATIFTAILSVLTGGIEHSQNIFLWGPVMGISFWSLYQVKPLACQNWQKYVWRGSALSLTLLAAILIIISIQYGLQRKVWTYSGKSAIGDYSIQTPPLQNWRCSHSQGIVLDQLARFIHNQVPKNDQLLILTDMQILYALTGRESYRGVPLFVMNAGHMPVPGHQAEMVRAELKSNPPDWIVTDIGSFMTLLPYLNFQQIMRDHYHQVQTFGTYAIFKKAHDAKI